MTLGLQTISIRFELDGKGETKNPKLKTLHKLAISLDMTVSELLNFPEMNETIFVWTNRNKLFFICS